MPRDNDDNILDDVLGSPEEPVTPHDERPPIRPVIAPSDQPRKRGRPPKRPEIDDVEDLSEIEAENVDYDSWIARFPWETGLYTCKIRRQAPQKLAVEGKVIDISGLLVQQDAPFSETELAQTFGGRTLLVVIMGPDRKTSKVRALSTKQVVIPGEPRLAPNALPGEVWRMIKPLLKKAGKLDPEFDTEDENEEVDERLNLRPHAPPQYPPGYEPPYRIPGSMYNFRGNQMQQEPIRTTEMLRSGFSEAAKMTREMAERSLQEKDIVLTRQRELLDLERARFAEEVDRAYEETKELRALLEKERNNTQKELAEQRAALLEAQKHQQEEARERERTAGETGFKLLETILPRQENNAAAQVAMLTSTYESRINTLTASHQTLLEAERRDASSKIESIRSLYTGEIEILRRQLTSETEERKRIQAALDETQKRMQLALDEAHRRAIEDVNRNLAVQLAANDPQRQMANTQALLATLTAMREAVGGGAPAEKEEDTSIIGKLVNMVEKTAPDIARAIASRNQGQIVQAPPVQSMQLVPVPQIQQIQPMPQPIIQQNIPRQQRPKISRQLLTKALNELTQVYNEELNPTEEEFSNFTKFVVENQQPELINFLRSVKTDGFITKLINDNMIPEKIKTEKGLLFLTKLIDRIKTHG